MCTSLLLFRLHRLQCKPLRSSSHIPLRNMIKTLKIQTLTEFYFFKFNFFEKLRRPRCDKEPTRPEVVIPQ